MINDGKCWTYCLCWGYRFCYFLTKRLLHLLLFKGETFIQLNLSWFGGKKQNGCGVLRRARLLLSLGRSGSDRSPHTGPDSDSFPWVRSWESFLSGPRVAGSPGQGTGVTFLGVKFNYPAGERVCCERWADGCPFPACDKGVKNHRKGLHYPEWERPMWLAARPPLSFTPLYNSTAESLEKFHSPFSALIPFSSSPLPATSPLLLSNSQKRAPTMPLEGWSGFFSTPVDSAHVDNIHRMSVNQSINQRHLMKEQLGKPHNSITDYHLLAPPLFLLCSNAPRRSHSSSSNCAVITKKAGVA